MTFFPVMSSRMSVDDSDFVAGVRQASCAADVMPRFCAVSSSSPPKSAMETDTSFFRVSMNR